MPDGFCCQSRCGGLDGTIPPQPHLWFDLIWGHLALSAFLGRPRQPFFSSLVELHKLQGKNALSSENVSKVYLVRAWLSTFAGAFCRKQDFWAG